MVALMDLDPQLNDAGIESGEDLCPMPLQDDAHSTHMGTSQTSVDNTIIISQTLIKKMLIYLLGSP